MVSDTIIAVMMLVLPSHPVQEENRTEIQARKENRFKELFQEADSAFEAKYHTMEYWEPLIEKAAKEAAGSADRKTAAEREKILNSGADYLKIIEDMKKQQYKMLRHYESK